MLSDFVGGYLYHVGLALALTAFIYAIGAGGLRLCLWPRRAQPADVVWFGFPVGVTLTGLLCFAALAGDAWRWAAVLATVVLLGLAATATRDFASIRRWTVRAVLVGLPAVLLLALIDGFLMRGPSDKLGWSGYGDIAWYVGRMFNFRHQLVPPFEFLLEGQRYPYAPHGPTMIGAVLLDVPGFNPFLFIAVTTPTLYSLTMIAALVADADSRDVPPRDVTLVAALILAGGLIYPSWLVESLPIAYAMPMLFAARRFLSPWPYAPWSLLVVGLLVAASSFLTKVFLITFVVGAVGAALLTLGMERLDRRQFIALLAIAAASLVAYVAWMLSVYGWAVSGYELGEIPVIGHLLRMRDAEAALVPLAGFAMRDAGMILLLLLAVRAERSWRTALIAGGMLQFWIIPGGSGVASTGATMLVALAVVEQPRWRRDLLTLALPGALLLAISSMMRERSSIMVFGATIPVMVLIWVAALRGSGPPSWHRGILAGQAAAGGLVLAVLAALAMEVGVLATAVSRQPHVLTPDAVDIWRQVRARTPPDALVFTDQTGEQISLSAGWNSLAASGGRQLYIAGWYHTTWRHRPELRAERYALNDAVLDGRRAPGTVPLSRGYGSYWAVVDRQRPVPDGFAQAYENGSFRLLRVDRAP